MLTRIILLFTTVVLLSFTNKPIKEGLSLIVEAHSSRNSDGIVQFSLYNKDGSIPDEHFEKFYRQKTAKITNGKATVTFDELPPGDYAINILHDENENGKVDRGFLMPIEGLGFSNYESLGFSNRPKYNKAKFNLSADTTIQIKMIYM